ncbi:hypothetical protein LX36DRAFT_212521 [Colletotrichum falcatum]|nr:hypothetical protein LX36DRAFT_212521 [Colletotrichum falcatum]
MGSACHKPSKDTSALAGGRSPTELRPPRRLVTMGSLCHFVAPVSSTASWTLPWRARPPRTLSRVAGRPPAAFACHLLLRRPHRVFLSVRERELSWFARAVHDAVKAPQCARGEGSREAGGCECLPRRGSRGRGAEDVTLRCAVGAAASPDGRQYQGKLTW